MKQTGRNKHLNTVVSCALLIAIELVLTRFCSLTLPTIRIGFGFAPIAVSGILFGPVYGFAVGGISDLIGANLFPSGPYHFGFTLVTALTGLVYGWLLHRKPGTPKWSRGKFIGRLCIALFINGFVLSLGLNTVWLMQLYDKAYMVLLVPRIVKEVIMCCVQFVVINMLQMVLVERILRSRPAIG